MKKKISVLHLPGVVGGNPQGLNKHLNQIGVKSELWAMRAHRFGYDVDKVITKNTDGLLMVEIKRLLALRYIFLFDVIFFNFGNTLFTEPPLSVRQFNNIFLKKLLLVYRIYCRQMQKLELFLLRVCRRKLFVQYQGDDARQGDYSLKNFSISIASQVGEDYYSPESDRLKREQIELLQSAECKMYALNPDLLRVLPPNSEFLPYSHISLSEWLPHFTQAEERPLRIGHAPSHRGAKGTQFILEALAQLKDEGFEFELILVEGVSNQEAKRQYIKIDVLVDQLFAGWYGGLGVEAMALGKPVVAYIRDEDLRYIPRDMERELPIIRATPDDIKTVLQSVLESPRLELLSLAKRSRAFVERWHDPIAIAERVANDFRSGYR